MFKNARYFPLVDSSSKMTNGGDVWQSHCAFLGLRETSVRIRIALEYIYRVVLFLHGIPICIVVSICIREVRSWKNAKWMHGGQERRDDKEDRQ